MRLASRSTSRARMFGWRLWALDITADPGVPTVAAPAENPQDGHFSIGFGSRPDGRIAAQRALSEVDQLLDIEAEAPYPRDRHKLPATGLPYPANGVRCTTRSTWQPVDAASLPAALAHCVGRSVAAGVDGLVVDKTRPDIGLSVVQVIAPGLRHFGPRFGARRLYPVPVDIGWCTRPRSEAELNPARPFP